MVHRPASARLADAAQMPDSKPAPGGRAYGIRNTTSDMASNDKQGVRRNTGEAASADRQTRRAGPEWANGLKQLYDSVVEEDLPDSFRDLLARLDEIDPARGRPGEGR